MKKLKERWGITSNWQIVIIFVVFAITGSSSLYVTTPLLNAIGLVKENFSHNTFMLIVYYVAKIVLIFPAYQLLLLFFGWIFGQYSFFWGIVKKMLGRIGFKSLVEKE